MISTPPLPTDPDGNAILIVETSGKSIVARLEPATRKVVLENLNGRPQTALAFASASTLLFTAQTNDSVYLVVRGADGTEGSRRQEVKNTRWIDQ